MNPRRKLNELYEELYERLRDHYGSETNLGQSAVNQYLKPVKGCESPKRLTFEAIWP